MYHELSSRINEVVTIKPKHSWHPIHIYHALFSIINEVVTTYFGLYSCLIHTSAFDIASG